MHPTLSSPTVLYLISPYLSHSLLRYRHHPPIYPTPPFLTIPTLSCLTLPRPTILYPIGSSPTNLVHFYLVLNPSIFYIILSSTQPYIIFFCSVPPKRILLLLYPIIFYPIPLYSILSHYILSYPIIFYPIPFLSTVPYSTQSH